MRLPFQELLDRIAAFPRAIQWAIWASIGTVAFLMWLQILRVVLGLTPSRVFASRE
jgi:hypothetical protein